MKKHLIFCVIMMSIGVMMLGIGASLFPMTDRLITATAIAFGQGAPASEFHHYIIGLLSGGSISLVPAWIVHFLIVSGLICVFLATFGYVNRAVDKPFRRFFRASHWISYEGQLSLNPDADRD